MRQKFFAMAGALVLLAVLGRFYAQPVLAQVRAALVSDVDNPARGFVQFSRLVGPPENTAVHEWKQDLQYAVPAGRRLVIDNISAVSFALSSNTVTTPFLLVIGNNAADCTANQFGIPAIDQAKFGLRAALAVPLVFNGVETSSSPSNSYGNSMRVQAYADAGQCLAARFTTTSLMTSPAALSVTISGHLVTP